MSSGNSLTDVLGRVADGCSTPEDAQRLFKWIHPDDQAMTVLSFLWLTCNTDKARKYIALDLRQNLAAELRVDIGLPSDQ